MDMNISINNLNLSETEIYEDFKKNLKKILQKLGSSKKTKNTHKLIESGTCQLGYGASNLTKDNTVLGSVVASGNKLSAIILDITKFVDPYDKQSIASKIKELKELQSEYSSAKRTISDLTEYKITTLEKHIKEKLDDIMESVDYFKLIDGYFHEFMKYLASRAMETKGQNKIIPEMLNIITEIMSKIINKTKTLNHDEFHEFNRSIEYAFIRTYTGQNHNSAFMRVKKLDDQADKYEDFYNDLKTIKFNEFVDIALILTKRNLITITPNGLRNLLKKTGGSELENSLKGELEDLIAYLISSNYQNQLFDGYQINKDAQNQLENYMLNFKKNITYTQR